MQLSGFLSEKEVCADLNAQNRDDAVRELLAQLVEVGKLGQECLETVCSAVLRREALGTTAFGRGVAVPHARIEGFDQTLMALGLSKQGVEFNALDGEPVHAIFLVIGSQEGAEEYTEILRRISVLIQNTDFRRFLSRTHSPTEVVDLVVEMDT